MPKLFAISDPHLSFDTPNKTMDRFGEVWVNHTQKIKQNWLLLVRPEDIVVIPGDISWAKKFEQAKADLQWIHHLPGTKIILRGNHDYWWPTNAKLEKELPPSIKFVHQNSVTVGNYVFFGSRLWDTPEYSLNSIIEWDPLKGELPQEGTSEEIAEQEKKYAQEIERLKISIGTMPANPNLICIGLCHYPPIGVPFKESKASQLFSAAGAKHVIFGHLHSVKKDFNFTTCIDKTTYHLTSCDYLGQRPKFIMED